MPLELRKQLQYNFLLEFVPFGASFEDFIKPILEDIPQLEHGMIVDTIQGQVWVVEGLGCVTADLPQGNDLAGVLRHNANFGCRTCTASKDQLTDPQFDYISSIHFAQDTDLQYKEIEL